MANEVRPLAVGDVGLPQGYAEAPWGRFRPTALQTVLIALAQRSFLHRGKLRHRMTTLIARLGAPLDVMFRGCRYRIEGRNNLMEYGLLLHPNYNGTEIDFLAEAVRDGGTMVDIGANIGLYSLPMAAAAGPAGRVIAIDANAGVLARLMVSAACSGLANIVDVNCAVGDREGTVSLTIRADDLSIVKVSDTGGGMIPIRPLLAILADIGVTRVDALKIDIEGHEDLALVPFFRDAPEAMLPRRVCIERGGADGGDYPGAAAAFDRLGYRLIGRTRSNSLYERVSAPAS